MPVKDVLTREWIVKGKGKVFRE